MGKSIKVAKKSDLQRCLSYRFLSSCQYKCIERQRSPFLVPLVLGSYPAGLQYYRSARTEKRLASERLLPFPKSASKITHSAIASAISSSSRYMLPELKSELPPPPPTPVDKGFSAWLVWHWPTRHPCQSWQSHRLHIRSVQYALLSSDRPTLYQFIRQQCRASSPTAPLTMANADYVMVSSTKEIANALNAQFTAFGLPCDTNYPVPPQSPSPLITNLHSSAHTTTFAVRKYLRQL